jgi:hypothetical protein
MAKEGRTVENCFDAMINKKSRWKELRMEMLYKGHDANALCMQCG